MTTRQQGSADPFGARASLSTHHGTTVTYYRLQKLVDDGILDSIERLPFTVRILLENVLRNAGGEFTDQSHVEGLAKWQPQAGSAPDDFEVPFLPARVVLQDFTGVPCVVDLAAMRSAMERLGGDVRKINPLVPADLVIDHSVQVDKFGTSLAFARNVDFEYQRNNERYALLRWGQGAFQNFRVVPPGTGIVHQVNLEYLASVVETRQIDGELVALPDTLVGTDSHTTMINGLGVLGWGVGGIEAEAVLLGQPLYQLSPEVVGFKFTGAMRPGTTATDLVLRVTEMLREHGVVGRFVEYCGTGLSNLSLADRATIANMAPEYGATAGLFPVDAETLNYMRLTGRNDDLIDLVERYTKEQGLFRTDETPDPVFNEMLELDLSTIEPSLAGPRRPQDRVPLGLVRNAFRETYEDRLSAGREKTQYDEQVADSFPASDPPATMASGNSHGVSSLDDRPAKPKLPTATLTRLGKVEVEIDGLETDLHHGAVAIAAITSCTNTSNPSVMLGAGLLAKKAVERGLDVSPYVKTSLAPGSQVVTRYLDQAGLTPYLSALGFQTVGYGCTTCIGNSGPLPEPVAKAIDENDLVVASVLSGNRNFEGRIHPQVRASFLASPPLVVAYALAGSVDIDLETEPLGNDPNGDPVYLADVWPTEDEIEEAIATAVTPEMFREEYATVFAGDERWKNLPVPEGDLYEWDPASTYVQEPPFFQDISLEPQPVADIAGARVLALLGDSVTTDHISPAGSIARTSPAALYLQEHDVKPFEFNSYGSRRGNHEVMIRGTFANIRLRNQLTPEKEGNWTRYLPTNEEMSIYEASEKYQADGTPLVVIAGKEYGTGSSRDWAAKGTLLLGVRVVIAESFERIHRSNLVGMGVLPLQYLDGETARTHGLTGAEVFAVAVDDQLKPRQRLTVKATAPDGSVKSFEVMARIDTPEELSYYKNGGILPHERPQHVR
ncbi:MAG TPA: aconitate hydratase, partial [Thermomicrobiales bacterium]|nr:aconitate hydratase [Thermomicrobiales bacterium]